MPLSSGRKRVLPSMVLALTGLAMVLATAAWFLVRSREREQALHDHLESEQVVAQTGAAGIAAIVNGLASDLDRLSRVASVRYLEQPERLARTLGSFLERTAVPTRALVRVDTAGRILFVHPEDELPRPALEALRRSGYLARAASSPERLLSRPIPGAGGEELVAFSDLIQPGARDPLGAIIALFPASFLASPIQRAGELGGHWVVLRDEWGAVLHRSGGGLLEGVESAAGEAGDDFVARAQVASEVEPGIRLELWSTRAHALAPLRESFPGALFLLLLTNGLLATGGGFLARELRLRQRLDDSMERHDELEKRLQEAQKLESLGRLAGGIAHDFNNVLTAIQGSARLLEEKLDPDDPDREEASAILQVSGHAADLTRQLLAFARRQTLHPKVLDLDRAVRRMEPILRRTLREDIHLTIESPSRDAWIRIDPTHLEQVLLNLAVNARDAMPRGGSLRISMDAADDGEEPGGYARLTVEDDGKGIPADAIPNVFEPFFTTKPAGHGTGLGLATVYGIVKQSGGDIRVESQEGEGTRFILLFPRPETSDAPGAADPAWAEEIPPREPTTGPRSAPAPDGGATILLVEDNAAVRRVAERALVRRGHRVIAAGSGDEALRIAAATPGPIDLLLTDVVMPGMNGRELADLFAVTRRGTPVLFMSGYMEDEVLDRGILESDTRFLEKPFTPDVLARSVEAALAAPDPTGSAAS